MVAEREASEQAISVVQDRPAQQERSESPGMQQPAGREGALRRFRRRSVAKAEPDLYPSQQDARACGLFI